MRTRGPWIGLALAGLVTACADDGGSGDTGTDTDATTTATGSTTGTGTGSGTGSGSSSGTASGSSTGGQDCPEEGRPGPAPETCPCDPWLQDCQDGLKCAPVAAGGQNVWSTNECVPVDPDPKAPGQPCTAPDGPSAGIDDCEAGAVCWDVDARTGEGVCVELCTGTPDAPQCTNADHACSITNAGVLTLCLPQCDPIGQDCPDGQGCYPESHGFFCSNAVGTGGAYGDPCEFLNACEPGLWCADASAVPGCRGAVGCCTPLCDVGAANDCPDAAMGQTCVPLFEAGQAPAGYENVGSCAIP